MLKWIPYPMLRIAGFFTGGVLSGVYFPVLISFRFAVSLIIFLSVAFFSIRFFLSEKRMMFCSGLLGLMAIFFLGYCRLLLFTNAEDENHLSKIIQPIQAYEAVVRSVPEEKANSWKVEVEITNVKTKQWQPITGKLLLYVSKKEQPSLSWHYGDKILVRGNPQELRPPANPGEFDFKRFLSFRNISHQQYVQSSDVKFIQPNSRPGFIYYSHLARTWSMKKLNEFVHGDDERAIAIALVLGVTDGIDNDLQNAYAASGAMHVLAVSGMHVGIIYAIILFLFKPLNKYKGSKWLVAVISLVSLWAFSFVTGNSPSVLRAVTMFSFIAVARPFGKRTNIYNTLAASVFVLLIYNPYLIMSVGFQLSYLAVIGIVYLQRPLYNLWSIDNRIGDWMWQITCVSIAAQIATFSLGLLYFHQFPIYILISNLFVIPLSTLVLLVGIFLLAISFISPLASLTGIVLEWLIKALNWTVFKTEALPMSLINNIHITTFQCLLLVSIIVALILLVEFKSIRWLYFAFGFVLIYTIMQWQHFFKSIDQKQLIVYSINKHQAIEFVDRGQSYFVCDSLLQVDEDRIRFHISPNRLTQGVSQTSSFVPFVRVFNGIDYYQWKDKIVARVNNRNAKLPLNFSCDYVVVSNNSLNKKQLTEIRAEQIIFDGTNSKRWIDAIRSLKPSASTYSVIEQGAFILK